MAATAVQGSTVEIVGHSFQPPSGTCVIYSTLVNNGTRQIEAGLVRCLNTDIDNTCFDGHAFAEGWNGGHSFTCSEGYSFANGTGYYATAERDSPSSTYFDGIINGAEYLQGGFPLTGTVTNGYSWAEVSALGKTNPCPYAPSVSFYSWQRFDGSAWHIVNGSTVYHDPAGYTRCFNNISGVNSNGDFNAS